MALTQAGEPYLLFNQLEDPDEVDNRIHDPDLANLRDELKYKVLQHLMATQVQHG